MLEALTAKELMCSMTTKQVENLFREGFASQNVLLISTGIKELARRGDYDRILSALDDYLKAGNKFKLNSGFAIALSQCFFDVRSADPLLGHIGKDIAVRSGREKGDSYDYQAYKDCAGKYLSLLGEKLDPKAKEKLTVGMVVGRKIDPQTVVKAAAIVDDALGECFGC